MPDEKMNSPKFFRFEKKFGWGEIVAGIALVLSALAIWQSYIAREDSRILNKLDFRPTLSLDTYLKSDDKIPSHMVITNKGPIDAVQLQAELIFLQYVPTTKKVQAAIIGTDWQWIIDRLSPLKNVVIKFNENDLHLPSNWPHKEYRILEIRLSYRRQVDLKKYSESAFFFYNQEGRYVGEYDNSLNPEIYSSIKEAALKRFNIDKLSSSKRGNALHELAE